MSAYTAEERNIRLLLFTVEVGSFQILLKNTCKTVMENFLQNKK
jgi:hypothetical protein